jgi:hypothetical protein
MCSSLSRLRGWLTCSSMLASDEKTVGRGRIQTQGPIVESNYGILSSTNTAAPVSTAIPGHGVINP